MRRFSLKILSAALLALVFTPAFAHGNLHEVQGKVVSVDTEALTLTMEMEGGKTNTAPVEAKALDMLKSLQAGDEVVVMCRDDEKGAHKSVAGIKVLKKKAA